RDQTKERKYLRKIEEQEKRYRQFVHFSTDGIWRFDLDEPIDTNLPIQEQIKLIFQGGFLAECNDIYAQMYGFEKKEDIIGIRLTDVMKPEDVENIEYLKAFIENGYKLSGGISKEYDKYGNVKYFENNLVGIVENGFLTRAWGTQKDVTEKILLENSLRESEEKFRLLSEASLVGIYLIQDNKFAYINKALADVFGYSVDEVVGRLGPLDLTHPDDHPKVIENIKKRVSGEIEALNYSFKGVRKDGSVINVEVFGRRIIYQGKPGVIGTLLEITERVKLEEENRIRTQQLENIIEQTPNVAIQLYDIDGRIIYWNIASEKIYGYSKEEALGKTLDELIGTIEEANHFQNVLREISRTGKFYGPFESKFKRKDGTEGWILSTAFAIPSFKKTPVFVCMNIETTARKIAELNLQEQSELQQTLINTINSAILIYNDKNILFVNDALIKLTGYSVEELYSMPPWDLVHPDQRDMVSKIVQKRFKGELVPQNYEIKLLTKDGKVKWVNNAISMFNYKGQRAALGTGIDITDRKLNEEIIKIQYKIADAVVKEKTLYKFFEVVRNELSKVIDTTNLFVAFYDEESDELYCPFEWNEKMDAPVRWSAKKSLTGKVVKDGKTLFLKREDIQKLYEKGEIELLGSRAECWLGVPLFVSRKPYGAFVVQSYDNPNAYDERSIELLEMVASQLSSYVIQKMQTEELTKLSLAVEKALIGILITDVNGTIEYANPKICEITGYGQDELIGRNPRMVKSGFHSKEFYENLWNTILQGKEWVGEFLNRRKNGELNWEKGLISPILNEDGKITHFVAIKEDITEHKKLIEELINAKERALESEKLKTAFLANVSHEVRTPLNGLMGFAQILESQSVPSSEVKRFAKVILSKAEELLELFNDILDLSLIETNQIKITPKTTNISKILYDVYSTFSLNDKVRDKVIELRIKHSLPEDFTIVTDPLRLKQILNNLVDNALKFTKKGYVEFGAKLRETGEVEFFVKDTGIGIPKSMYYSIFEKFQQVDTDFLRKEYQGLGLGLPICRGLVNRLRGKIWVESELGEGSTFYFTISKLDLEMVSEKEELKSSLPDENFKVSEKQLFLVAEDDYVNYLVLEKFLKKNYECEILHASTGNEAIEILEKNPGISLIILDIRMPNMDGFTAFREIRKINPSVPIIALTAYSFLEDRRKIIEYGFDDYISKPFDSNELITKVNKLLSSKKL
ncbi:MAG: PAS domain S-box protein, partial [Candidatus Kapaibacteriota bacterium]